MVHSHPITNLEELQQRIQQEISKITERDIRNVLRHVKKWMKKCLDCNGEPFEYLLQRKCSGTLAERVK